MCYIWRPNIQEARPYLKVIMTARDLRLTASDISTCDTGSYYTRRGSSYTSSHWFVEERIAYCPLFRRGCCFPLSGISLPAPGIFHCRVDRKCECSKYINSGWHHNNLCGIHISCSSEPFNTASVTWRCSVRSCMGSSKDGTATGLRHFLGCLK